MSRLVKPADYAKETGISRQAVYAKIKRGSLASKEIGEQLFIVVDDDNKTKAKATVSSDNQSISKLSSASKLSQPLSNEFQTIIDAKNETIETLKNRIHDLKESNKELSSVFRSEIELLKEAFGEMKRIYSHQLEHNEQATIILNNDHEESYQKPKWVSVKKILKKFDVDKKHHDKIKKYLHTLYLGGDTRVSLIDDKIRVNLHNSSKEMIEEALED
ncbi:MAG: DUF3972 domain-containing protein [Campylobacterales bacterium]|nr:DUF3972 domain-containing protein [Campylobacterales bacterium]